MADTTIIPTKEEIIAPVPGADGAPQASKEGAPIVPTAPTPSVKPVARSYDAAPALGGSNDFTHTVKEEEETKEVTHDEFTNIIKARSGIATVEGPKKDEKKVEAGKEKTGEAANTTTASKLEITPVLLAAVPAEKEDWVKTYGDTAASHFKKMSQDAREFVQARLKENGELRAKNTELETKVKAGIEGLPQSYYEHQNAFILDPKYGESAKQENLIAGELNHWKAQFAKIRAGDKWQDMQNGRLVELDADANSELYVSEIIARGNAMIQQEHLKQQGLQGSFKQQFEARVAGMRSIEDQYFPDMKDEKTLKPEAKKYYDIMKGVLKERGMENDALAGIVTKLYTHHMNREEYIKDIESKSSVAAKLAEKAALAGPTSGDINNTNGRRASSIDTEEVDFKAYERVKGI